MYRIYLGLKVYLLTIISFIIKIAHPLIQLIRLLIPTLLMLSGFLLLSFKITQVTNSAFWGFFTFILVPLFLTFLIYKIRLIASVVSVLKNLNLSMEKFIDNIFIRTLDKIETNINEIKQSG